MSEGPPRPSVSPSSITLKMADRAVTKSLEIVNKGGGRLRATVSPQVGWISVDPRVIEDNHVRIAVTIDASTLPEDVETESALQLAWDRFTLEIPVRVTRQGLLTAWHHYEQGDHTTARELAVAVAQTSSRPEAQLLIATTWLDAKNHAAAVRPLRDAAAALAAIDAPRPLDPCGKAIAHRFVEAMGSALPTLRDSRFGIDLLEQLRVLAPDLDPSLEISLDALLSEAAALLAREFPPAMLGADDRKTTQALVARLSKRLPDAEALKDWLAQAALTPEPIAEAPLLLESQAEPPDPRFRALGVLLVVAVCISVAWLFLRASWPLRHARALMAGGQHAEALKMLEAEVARNGSDTTEIRTLRAEVNLSLAQAQLERGEFKEAATSLARTLRDDGTNRRALDLRRTTHHRWAEDAEKNGRLRESFEALEALIHMQPPDEAARARLRELLPLRRLYVAIDDIEGLQHLAPNGKPMQAHPVDLDTGRAAREWLPALQKLDIRTWRGCTQVTRLDGLSGMPPLIVVAGSDTRSAGVDVYTPRADGAPRVEKLTGAVAPSGLRLLSLRPGSGAKDGAERLCAAFAPPSGQHATFEIGVACGNGKVTLTPRAAQSKAARSTP
ncbi:MAG: tetratricopeptide repeat protein [Proteobacteria bacterium]|nr:tetratricopeptide repeat protein [Pseudomonadota bacterium]